MTIGDLKDLTHPPESELHLPISEEEFIATVGTLRAEWARGEAIIMAPDNTDHGDLNSWLGTILLSFVANRGLGQVFINSIETRLPSGSHRVPDIMFISETRRNIIRQTFVDGPPDLAIEIVSPDSVTRDYREKYHDYEQSGVREYWLIDPRYERVNAYTLTDREYQTLPVIDDKLTSAVLPGFYFRAAWLWTRPRPRPVDVMKEIGF